jgi:hypothetical protein
MLISAQLKASNLVYTGSITVDPDSLESAYIKAYGEPLLPLGGDIPYTPITGSPDVLSFNLSTDIGTVTGGGVATVPGLGTGGYAIQGRGGMPISPTTLDGFFYGRDSVSTDFTLRTQLITTVPGATLTSPAPAEGLVTALALFETVSTNGTTILFGVIQPKGGTKELAVYQRSTVSGVLTRIAGVVLSSYDGLYLQITRSTTLEFSYSVDNGTNWIVLTAAVTGALASSYAAGLVVNNGSLTLLDDTSKVYVENTLLRKGDLGHFNILNAGYALMRSQSPHQFFLDAKIDPEAENKVKGWMAEMRTRLISLKDVLMANDNPLNDENVTVEQA